MWSCMGGDFNSIISKSPLIPFLLLSPVCCAIKCTYCNCVYKYNHTICCTLIVHYRWGGSSGIGPASNWVGHCMGRWAWCIEWMRLRSVNMWNRVCQRLGEGAIGQTLCPCLLPGLMQSAQCHEHSPDITACSGRQESSGNCQLRRISLILTA